MAKRLLTEDEIVKEASKDGIYCQLSVDIGMWAATTQDARTLKAAGEWIEKHDGLVLPKYVEAFKRGEMPEEA